MDFNIDKYRSKPTQKRHRRRLQILLIPDDQGEPKAFSLSMRQLKAAKVLGVFLILHTLLGFYGYALISKYLIRVHSLEYDNQQLSENNKRIHELAGAFKALEDTDDKIRAALGLNKAPAIPGLAIESLGNASSYISDQQRFEEKSQALAMTPATTQVKVGEKLGMLQQSAQSGLHDYLRDIPTYLPVEGVLTNDYSSDEKKQGGSGHQGIDIAAPRGSFVRAAGDGVVVFSGWTEDLGNLIILYHGNGFFTYYGHNQRLLVLRNIFVRKSGVIALVGNSGLSSAPHLHFEIWKDGVPLDPKQYILAFSRM